MRSTSEGSCNKTLYRVVLLRLKKKRSTHQRRRIHVIRARALSRAVLIICTMSSLMIPEPARITRHTHGYKRKIVTSQYPSAHECERGGFPPPDISYHRTSKSGHRPPLELRVNQKRHSTHPVPAVTRRLSISTPQYFAEGHPHTLCLKEILSPGLPQHFRAQP